MISFTRNSAIISKMDNVISHLLNEQVPDTVLIIQLLISVFLAILFLQSGIDKLVDWKGNLNWLKEHFATSPLGNRVPLMLGVVTILEVSAGLLSAIGFVTLILWEMKFWAFLGVLLSAVNLVLLFFGQRMAKDYAGAAVLVNYFILTIIGLFFLS